MAYHTLKLYQDTSSSVGRGPHLVSLCVSWRSLSGSTTLVLRVDLQQEVQTHSAIAHTRVLYTTQHHDSGWGPLQEVNSINVMPDYGSSTIIVHKIIVR